MAWAARLSAVTRRRQGVLVWLLAVFFVAMAVGLRMALAYWLELTPFIPFMIATMAAALVCGWRPAVFALILSAVAGWYLCLPQEWSFTLAGPQGGAAIVAFLIVGSAQIALVATLAELVSRLDVSNEMRANLYQELQHRVANNMQIVAGMLDTAQRDIADPAAVQVIDRAANRISAVGQLHRRLSAATAFDNGLKPVITDILAEAFEGLQVIVDVAIEPARLTVNQMTAIVLLVSEAATNAAKHVFRPGLGCHFTVSLHNHNEGRAELILRDDGPGLGAREAAVSQGLGMDIMHGFARQLGGRLHRLEGDGTTLSITFSPGA